MHNVVALSENANNTGTLTTFVPPPTDEFLAVCAQKGDSLAIEHLITRYKNLVRAKVRPYFLIGADHEDIIQEGMIGLFKAIRDFRDNKSASFKSFADLCITRQIITAIKTATRHKHLPLNTSVSLSTPIFDDESGVTLEDVITEKSMSNPEDFIIVTESLKHIEEKISENLSIFEYSVLESYLDGHSYQDIAAKLGKQVKSVDNALQRVKKKLEDYLLCKA